MIVQFGNNWLQNIPLTAKLDSAYGFVQFWLSSEFFSSNYFQIGQHVVQLHIQIQASTLQVVVSEEFKRADDLTYMHKLNCVKACWSRMQMTTSTNRLRLVKIWTGELIP